MSTGIETDEILDLFKILYLVRRHYLLVYCELQTYLHLFLTYLCHNAKHTTLHAKYWLVSRNGFEPDFRNQLKLNKYKPTLRSLWQIRNYVK